MLKILHLAHIFPNEKQPVMGTHIHSYIQAASIKSKCTTIAPVPVYEEIETHEENVYHPSYMAKGYDFPFDMRSFLNEYKSYKESIFDLIKREQIKFDVIHAHFPFPDSLVAKELKEKTGKNYIVSVQGTWLLDKLKQYPHLKKKADEAIYESDLVTSAHPEILDQINKEYPEKSPKNLKLPVNIKRFGSGNPLKIREELDISSDKFVVIFIGRFEDLKDPMTFIESAIDMSDEKDIKFIMVGDDDSDFPFRNEMEKKVENNGGNVIFTGFRADVKDFLETSDLFVSLNTYDNIWTMSPLEAMASKTPTVLTDVGYTKEKLKHRKNTYLIKPKSAGDLTRAIHILKNNNELRKKIVKNAFQLVKNNFSQPIISTNSKRIYKEVFN